jgi:hypothetical protein
MRALSATFSSSLSSPPLRYDHNPLRSSPQQEALDGSEGILSYRGQQKIMAIIGVIWEVLRQNSVYRKTLVVNNIPISPHEQNLPSDVVDRYPARSSRRFFDSVLVDITAYTPPNSIFTVLSSPMST